MRRVDTLVIHHSAGPTGNIREFRVQHRARGWKDVGYHALVGNGNGCPDGHIQAGRPEDEVGAGVYGNNTGKLQVVLVGQFDPDWSGYTGPPTVRQLSALGHWLWTNGRQYQAASVVGHKEITKPGHGTACPGDLPLEEIRRWYEINLPKAKPEPLNVYLAKHGYPGKEGGGD